MSEIFSKSCYTTRSSGYKYRTLSTNTGEKRRRDAYEDSLFDRKLKELKREMQSRIENEVEEIADARESMVEKINKIDAKIGVMIELQETITGLRKKLSQAETMISGMWEKVARIEAANSDASNLQSKKNSFRSEPPILEETELFSSTITHF